MGRDPPTGCGDEGAPLLYESLLLPLLSGTTGLPLPADLEMSCRESGVILVLLDAVQ